MHFVPPMKTYELQIIMNNKKNNVHHIFYIVLNELLCVPVICFGFAGIEFIYCE